MPSRRSYRGAIWLVASLLGCGDAGGGTGQGLDGQASVDAPAVDGGGTGGSSGTVGTGGTGATGGMGGSGGSGGVGGGGGMVDAATDATLDAACTLRPSVSGSFGDTDTNPHSAAPALCVQGNAGSGNTLTFYGEVSEAGGVRAVSLGSIVFAGVSVTGSIGDTNTTTHPGSPAPCVHGIQASGSQLLFYAEMSATNPSTIQAVLLGQISLNGAAVTGNVGNTNPNVRSGLPTKAISGGKKGFFDWELRLYAETSNGGTVSALDLDDVSLACP